MGRTREPILAFDIETVPDTAGLRQKYPLPADVPDADAVDLSQRLGRQQKNSDFLPLPFHHIVTISCVFRDFANDTIDIFSLPADANAPAGEKSAIADFFRLVGKHQPVLVSWNGGSFDLPVLHYRSLIHRIAAPGYWQAADRWNTYLGRFHTKHTDLMDVLAAYQTRAWASLSDVAKLCGLPGKIGIGGAGVWDAYQQGDIASIRNYCEADALLTYLLYVRFLHICGQDKQEEAETTLVRQHLAAQNQPHWRQFLSEWGEGDAKQNGDGDGRLV